MGLDIYRHQTRLCRTNATGLYVCAFRADDHTGVCSAVRTRPALAHRPARLAALRVGRADRLHLLPAWLRAGLGANLAIRKLAADRDGATADTRDAGAARRTGTGARLDRPGGRTRRHGRLPGRSVEARRGWQPGWRRAERWRGDLVRALWHRQPATSAQ